MFSELNVALNPLSGSYSTEYVPGVFTQKYKCKRVLDVVGLSCVERPNMVTLQTELLLATILPYAILTTYHPGVEIVKDKSVFFLVYVTGVAIGVAITFVLPNVIVGFPSGFTHSLVLASPTTPPEDILKALIPFGTT